MISWWTEDFAAKLPKEQERMKRELAPASVERVLERIRRIEERELRGLRTDRNAIAPLDHVIVPQQEEIDGTEETGT